MKKIIFAALVYLGACSQKNNNRIEGVYTRESTGEFSRAFDTLMIFDFDNKGTTYLVRRKTGIIRFKDGLPQPRQWRTEQMIISYDEGSNQLTDGKTGRVFSFKENELLFGTAVYRRIKGR